MCIIKLYTSRNVYENYIIVCLYFYRPPSYEELMKHRSAAQSTENRNIRSTHINELGDANSDYLKSNKHFNCHNSSNTPSIQNSGEQRNRNERDLPFHAYSTSIQLDTHDLSTSFPLQNDSAENRSPKQFPLINGIQNLHVDGGQQRLFSIEHSDSVQTKFDDDDAEPPPCYSELFEKPLSPSTSNTK